MRSDHIRLLDDKKYLNLYDLFLFCFYSLVFVFDKIKHIHFY